MPQASFFLLLIDAEGNQVEGEAQEQDYRGQIEVSSWDWGISDKAPSNSQGASTGSAGSRATPAPQPAAPRHQGPTGEAAAPVPFAFSKPTDSSTTRLLLGLINEEHFESAVFTLRQQLLVESDSGTMERQDFVQIIALEDVTIKSFSFSADGKPDGVDMKENWEVQYTSLVAEMLFGDDGFSSVPFEMNPNAPGEALAPAPPSPTAMQNSIRSSQDSIDDLRTTLRSYEERIRELERQMRGHGRG